MTRVLLTTPDLLNERLQLSNRHLACEEERLDEAKLLISAGASRVLLNKVGLGQGNAFR